MMKENFKEQLRRFKIPSIFIISLAIVSLTVILIIRGTRIGLKMNETKTAIENSEYRITRFEVNEYNYFTHSAFLKFKKKEFVFLIDSIEVNGEYKLKDEQTIALYNCDTLSEIICKQYSVSVTSRGINLISQESLLTGVRISEVE